MNHFLFAGFLVLCCESPGTRFETFLEDIVISESLLVWLYSVSWETAPDFFLNLLVNHKVHESHHW